MNRVAAIFTSVYTVIKKACRGVKNNYDTSQDEGKILWTYLAQLVACLFGIGICILIFILWTDHREQVRIVDVENHSPNLSKDSCYLSVHTITGESFKGVNMNGIDGTMESIWYSIDIKRNIERRYSHYDIESAAKSRKIDLVKDSIKQDSCAYILTFNNYIGSNVYGSGFYKNPITSYDNQYYKDYKAEEFAPAAKGYIPKDSLPYLGLFKRYNKELAYLSSSLIYVVDGNYPKRYYPFNRFEIKHSIARSWFSRGDLSTSNYFLYFKLREIDLDEIDINFKTPTIINNIYPEPDVLDLYYMQYTDSAKLAHIHENGLSYEMEFVSGKSLQDFRMNVLIMVMSILITYVLSILYRVIVILCKSDHISKGQIQVMIEYPIVCLILAIIVGKLVNMIYAPWTTSIFRFISSAIPIIYASLSFCLFGKCISSHKLIIKEDAIYYLWVSIILLIYISLSTRICSLFFA